MSERFFVSKGQALAPGDSWNELVGQLRSKAPETVGKLLGGFAAYHTAQAAGAHLYETCENFARGTQPPFSESEVSQFVQAFRDVEPLADMLAQDVPGEAI